MGGPAVINAVRFIDNLTHTKGEHAGKPFDLRPWQRAFLEPLFGTLTPNGRRQYRTCYVEIPRKNGKTEIAAAIALYMLIGDGEQGGEVYSAASDRDQASLVFGVAAQMVRNDPELSQRLEIIDSRRRIFDPVTNSIYQAIPAEAAGRHGYNASAVIIDEVHALPNRDLYDVLTSSTGARSQPMTFCISTAGYDRHSICWELHQYAENVRDGIIIDPSFMPVLYSAPVDADWTDPDVWRAANPALGDFRSLEEFEIAARRAQEVPGQQNAFRRLYLCQWTEQSNRWLDMATWDECAGDVDVSALIGRECWAGLDLSSTTDLSALALVFGPDDDDVLDVLMYYFVPEDRMRERVQRDRVPYDVWVRDGYITATEGNVVDYDVVRAKLNDLVSEGFNIREVAIDPWNATHISTQLMGDGFEVVHVRQGFASLTAPTKELERRIISRTIRHGGNPVLRWNAANVAIAHDPAGNIKPDKAKSTERIDGIAALVNALSRSMVSEPEAQSTVMWV